MFRKYLSDSEKLNVKVCHYTKTHEEYQEEFIWLGSEIGSF